MTNRTNVGADGDGINVYIETDGGTAVGTNGDRVIDALDTDSDSDGTLDSPKARGDTRT